MEGRALLSLLSRIAEGEGLHLDFKQRIESARKIARTLSAFANTAGGSLLIGVKDNGRIAGIDPEQEFYMVELAAHRYLSPPIPFESLVYNCEEKYVLEIQVAAHPDKRPVYVLEEGGIRRAYVRAGDKTRLAGRLLERLWLAARQPQHIFFRQAEAQLFRYLQTHPFIEATTFRQLLGPKEGWKAERILIKYTLIGVLRLEILPETERFYLADPAHLPPQALRQPPR
ncbi:MAG: ATP-binding protein [Bacteroidia bacterium]